MNMLPLLGLLFSCLMCMSYGANKAPTGVSFDNIEKNIMANAPMVYKMDQQNIFHILVLK